MSLVANYSISHFQIILAENTYGRIIKETTSAMVTSTSFQIHPSAFPLVSTVHKPYIR